MKVDVKKLAKNSNLNEFEEEILDYICNNINSLKKRGVRGIAKQFYTSTTTIMNIAKKLGYEGFTDMYYDLIFKIKYDSARISENSDKAVFYTEEELQKVASLLDDNKDNIIYTCAKGLSAPIIEYMTRKLIIKGFKCIMTESYDSFEENEIGAKVLLVLSKSGETNFINLVVRLAKEKGITVIAFTNHLDNLLSNLADVNIKIYDEVPIDDRNRKGNVFFGEAIIAFEKILKYMKG